MRRIPLDCRHFLVIPSWQIGKRKFWRQCCRTRHVVVAVVFAKPAERSFSAKPAERLFNTKLAECLFSAKPAERLLNTKLGVLSSAKPTGVWSVCSV